MYHFLLIEDSMDDRDSFQDTVNRMNEEAGSIVYELQTAENYQAGMNAEFGKYDGVIMDIKLDAGQSGTDIIHKIIDEYRIPVVVFTGTPEIEREELPHIQIYKKGEAKHEDILKNLCSDLNTGIYNIFGGTGKLEKHISDVFWNYLYPNISVWKTKKERGIDTESILLRYAVSIIQEMLDINVPKYEIEEMYICPPVSPNIQTGSIVKKKDDDTYCIVLSPPCDLAIHDDKYKTDSFFLCKIDTIEAAILEKDRTEKLLKKAIKNNEKAYYHWLPGIASFKGGFINFRKTISLSLQELSEKYEKPQLKVQEYFVKNILNRFSVYYARQGQPDFDFDYLAKVMADSFTKQ